jgi:hypothetical protein
VATSPKEHKGRGGGGGGEGRGGTSDLRTKGDGVSAIAQRCQPVYTDVNV